MIIRTEFPHNRRPGLTLIECLWAIGLVSIVMLILSVLAGRPYREYAPGAQCTNNLKDLLLATANYESVYGMYPPAGALFGEPPQAGYSGFVFLLPFFDQNYLHSGFNFDLHADPASHNVKGLVNILICPASSRVSVRHIPGTRNMPTNYAFNIGEWKIHDPNSNALPAGPFGFGKTIGIRQVRDGTSDTFAFTEVIAGQSNLTDSILPEGSEPKAPSDEKAVSRLGGRFRQNWGHSDWTDGNPLQIGVTSTFAPNTFVTYPQHRWDWDIDYLSLEPGVSKTRPSFAAITARGNHRGGTRVGYLDGSVRFVKDGCNLQVWRSLGTYAGGETINEPEISR